MTLGANPPAISVITIVKNNEKLLPRAIESVLSQSLSEYEFIIVNDGSSDGTRRVIDSYAQGNENIVGKHLTNNVGRAMARNRGLESAKGRYIFFLDSDDYLPEDALKRLYEVAVEKDAELVYGNIKCFDSITGEWLDKHYTQDIIDCERHGFNLNDCPSLVFNHTLGGRLFSHSMLKKHAICFSTSRRNGEDVLFCFYTAYYANKISMVPGICAYCYSIGNYINTANEQKLIDARENVLETISFSLRNGSSTLKRIMLKKGALFAADLIRAYKVYGDQPDKLLNYINSLKPLVVHLTDVVLAELTGYPKRFAKALLAGDYQAALKIFETHKAEEICRKLDIKITGKKTDKPVGSGKREKDDLMNSLKAEMEQVRSHNWALSLKLDALYRSRSWRMTAPIRFVARRLRNL